ncbi:MAG TPA: phosphoribosylaminoimidazolesuccinocarboxamide synthase [Saprospiraceae bacterium]|nr:phosphoribosylaminoimidazolesuccinocarboxamide synthase [Saprospiraceae bacterium]HNT18777.1 phosphoribosylaminoimidazolesuccinocarboxamide synthase [Saprospiraceae bacterium]
MSEFYSPIGHTDFHFSPDQGVYKGKVREIYTVGDRLISIASDRISAFDHILPRLIPYKGQVLNQVAAHFLEATRDLVPNWLESVPHPNVSIGKKCKPVKLEFVVRGYLAGHAWREYQSGKRMICGVHMPEGLKESDRFPQPLITPSTKAEQGHDEDISKEQAIAQGLCSLEEWITMERYALALFNRGTEMAADQGLILVDTKYEFGRYNDQILLIDEVHTPDSSRYYYLEGYAQRQESGERQKQLSKEFVREWLMAHGFAGKAGQVMPDMPDAFVWEISDRYIELYEKVTGKAFQKDPDNQNFHAIEQAVRQALKSRPSL